MEKSTSKTGALNAVAVDGSMSASAQSAMAAAAASAAALAALASLASAAVSADGQDEDGEACYVRPGDDGFEECEACQ